MSNFARAVLTTTPAGNPLTGIVIEMIRSDTMKIVQAVTTNLAGEAQFTTPSPATVFFRPRITRKDWNLQVTSFGGGRSIYDRVVSKDGQGTDTTIVAAVAALATTGGSIGLVRDNYDEYLTIPAIDTEFTIEGIGPIPVSRAMNAPAIHSTAAQPVITVPSAARLTLRGVSVVTTLDQVGIRGTGACTIVLDQVYVSAYGYAVASANGFTAIDSYLVSTGGSALPACAVAVKCVNTRIKGATGFYAWDGYFGECYFDRCTMSGFRCSSGTVAVKLQIEHCTISSIQLLSGSPDRIQDVILDDNVLDNGAGDCIVVAAGVDRITCTGNDMHTTGGHGIHITGAVKGGAFSGNVCGGNAAGYTIEADHDADVALCSFAANAHDGTMAGVYGPHIVASTITVPHALLDGVVHSDTLLGGVTDGDMITGNVTPKWSRVAITIPGGAALMNVWSVVNGELRGSWRAVLDATNPAGVALTAAPGTSLVFAHRDHVHAHTVLASGDLHTEYLLAAGTRALTAQWNPGAFIIGNYDFTAKPAALYVGDANCSLTLEAGGPALVMDTGLDFMGYVRASNYFNFSVGGVEYLRIGTMGLLVDHIIELTADRGVEIETVPIKDGLVDGVDVSTIGAASHAAITLAASAAVLLDLTGQALSLDTQAANTVLAGRVDVGAAQAPTFRAIVALDLGAGGDNTKYLRGDMTWQVVAGGGSMATDPLWAALGDIPYATGNDAGAVLTGNVTVTRKFLRQVGDGAASAAPAWDTIADADVPATHSGTAHHAAITLSAEADVLLGLSTQQVTLDTQAANTVFAGRVDAGAALAPTFRALVALDIPNLSGTYSILAHTHAAYLNKDGTVALTGNWNPGAFIVGNYDFTAKPTVLYVGDANFCFSVFGAGGYAGITFDSTDDMYYDRASNMYVFRIASVGVAAFIAPSTLWIDHLTELTGDHGVAIETSLLKDGYMRIGSVAAPTNITAGDLTVGRVLVGADGAFVSGTPLLQVGGAAAVVGHMSAGASGVPLVAAVFSIAETITNTTSAVKGLLGDLIFASTKSLQQAYGYNFALSMQASDAGVVAQSAIGFSISISHASTRPISSMTGFSTTFASTAAGTFYGASSYVVGLNVDTPEWNAASVPNYVRGLWVRDLGDANGNDSAAQYRIGVDIAAFTGAGIRMGIRNASPYVATPSANQTLAAATAILANAEVVQITSTADRTLTAAPTIADGQTGQRVTIINDGSFIITLQDQGTLASSNLRLAATGLALAPRDSVTLMFNATINDWVQIGAANVI